MEDGHGGEQKLIARKIGREGDNGTPVSKLYRWLEPETERRGRNDHACDLGALGRPRMCK